jgi:hypothetical protein
MLSSNLIDVQLTAPDGSFVHQPLTPRTLFSVAIHELERSLLKLENADIGLTALAQGAEFRSVIEYPRRTGGYPLNRLVKTQA